MRERIFTKPVIWSGFCKMARDQLDSEAQEVMLVEAGAVCCNACQHGFSCHRRKHVGRAQKSDSVLGVGDPG